MKKETHISGTRCVIRLGKPGCGKSLDQTEQDVLYHLKEGVDVYCCYWINWAGANFHYFPPTKKGWESISDKRNCVVVFDELAQVFDPRDWSEEGSAVRRWFQLHRHFHVDIYANTQDVSLVAKTIGIVAEQWQLIEKIDEHPIILWLLKYWYKFTDYLKTLAGATRGKELPRATPVRIRIRKEYLSYQQLKKIANGWELGEDVAIEGDWEFLNYRPVNIIHRELNEFKSELYHYFCPKCQSRQGGSVSEEDIQSLGTFARESQKTCGKHKDTQLEIRETGLYDTDYTPETDEEEVEFRPYIDSPKGYTKIIHKGLLSEEQTKMKRQLEMIYNRKPRACG